MNDSRFDNGAYGFAGVRPKSGMMVLTVDLFLQKDIVIIRELISPNHLNLPRNSEINTRTFISFLPKLI